MGFQCQAPIHVLHCYCDLTSGELEVNGAAYNKVVLL